MKNGRRLQMARGGKVDYILFVKVRLCAASKTYRLRRLYGTFLNEPVRLIALKGSRVMKSLFFIVYSFSKIIAPE